METRVKESRQTIAANFARLQPEDERLRLAHMTQIDQLGALEDELDRIGRLIEAEKKGDEDDELEVLLAKKAVILATIAELQAASWRTKRRLGDTRKELGKNVCADYVFEYEERKKQAQEKRREFSAHSDQSTDYLKQRLGNKPNAEAKKVFELKGLLRKRQLVFEQLSRHEETARRLHERESKAEERLKAQRLHAAKIRHANYKRKQDQHLNRLQLLVQKTDS